MPFIISKERRPKSTHSPYLGFDESGNHQWKRNRLDAIRFTTEHEAYQSCCDFLKTGATLIKVGDWDGHYTAHNGYEIQIFKDDLKLKPGGHRWRFRIGPLTSDRAYEYSQGAIGYTTHTDALKAARMAVNKRHRIGQLA